MFLTNFHILNEDKKFQNLLESLEKDFGIDVLVYQELSEDELEAFAIDLENKKFKIIAESTFNSYYQNPNYVRTSLLLEAIRIILREICPKRKPKNLRPIKESIYDIIVFSVDSEEAYNVVMQNFSTHISWDGDQMTAPDYIFAKIDELLADMGLNAPIETKFEGIRETLDYKVHSSTGVAVDHDIDEDKERPDLYWRRHQWEAERSQENHPVTVHDGGKYGLDGPPTQAYAQNVEPDPTRTHEDEQEAGVYVAVMNPNRFLGDKETRIMSITPTVKSENEESVLTRKVSPVMVDATETENNLFSEGEEEMTEKKQEGLVEGLGTLLEGELERAEIVLATKDLGLRLQKMIEDLGNMGTDDIMPLVDGLRNNFGGNIAEKFSQGAEQHIQNAAESIQAFKDAIDSESQRLEGRISDEDAETPVNDMTLGGEPGSGLSGEPEELDLGGEIGGEESLEDMLGGEEANASEEPLGRARKEGRVITISGKKVKLSEEQVAALMVATAIKRKLNALIEAATPKTAIINIQGMKFRLTEDQIKSLIFAKNFNRIVESRKARTAKLSESQAMLLKTAKGITEKIRNLVNEKVLGTSMMDVIE